MCERACTCTFLHHIFNPIPYSCTYTVHQLLEAEEQSGTPTNRIVLGGFSQGGALAIYSALTYPRQLGGLLCLSGYALLHKKLIEVIVCVCVHVCMLNVLHN